MLVSISFALEYELLSIDFRLRGLEDSEDDWDDSLIGARYVIVLHQENHVRHHRLYRA